MPSHPAYIVFSYDFSLRLFPHTVTFLGVIFLPQSEGIYGQLYRIRAQVPLPLFFHNQNESVFFDKCFNVYGQSGDLRLGIF